MVFESEELQMSKDDNIDRVIKPKRQFQIAIKNGREKEQEMELLFKSNETICFMNGSRRKEIGKLRCNIPKHIRSG